MIYNNWQTLSFHSVHVHVPTQSEAEHRISASWLRLLKLHSETQTNVCIYMYIYNFFFFKSTNHNFLRAKTYRPINQWFLTRRRTHMIRDDMPPAWPSPKGSVNAHMKLVGSSSSNKVKNHCSKWTSRRGDYSPTTSPLVSVHCVLIHFLFLFFIYPCANKDVVCGLLAAPTCDIPSFGNCIGGRDREEESWSALPPHLPMTELGTNKGSDERRHPPSTSFLQPSTQINEVTWMICVTSNTWWRVMCRCKCMQGTQRCM